MATYFFLGGGEGMVVQKGLFSINYTIQRCSNLNLGRMFIQKSLSAYRSAFSKFPSRCGTYQRATKQTQIGLLIHNNTPVPLVVMTLNLASNCSNKSTRNLVRAIFSQEYQVPFLWKDFYYI